MSRRLVLLSLVVLLIASVSIAAEKPWFDMENCAICKNLSSHEGLLENLNWAQYNISNGIVAVATVNDKYLDTYRAAHADMIKTSMKLQKGEALEMCNSCSALGLCMMKGPHQEYVETSNGDLWILTSDNAEVVAELQSWAKRNREAMAKMHSED